MQRPVFITADTQGNVLYPNASSSATNAAIVEISGSTGALTATQPPAPGFTYPYDVEIDPSNNLYVTVGTGLAANLYKYTYNAGTFTGPVQVSSTPNGTAARSYQLAMNGTLGYISQYYTTAPGVPPVAIPYTQPIPTETATSVSIQTNYGMAIDSSGNGWADGTASFVKLTTAVTGGLITSVTSGTPVVYTPTGGTASLRFMNIDGNNTLWAVDNNATNSALVSYNTTATNPTVAVLKPCIANAAGSCPTLSSSTNGVYGARIAQVDSTGSIWVVSSTNGNVVQVIGSAAPAWPLKAVQKPGLMP